MRHTTTVLLACLLLASSAVGCSSGPSYEETTKQCAAALEAQYKANGKGKPDECDGVKSDDHNTLLLNAAMGDLGWTDGDGKFDEDKMLDSGAEAP